MRNSEKITNNNKMPRWAKLSAIGAVGLSILGVGAIGANAIVNDIQKDEKSLDQEQAAAYDATLDAASHMIDAMGVGSDGVYMNVTDASGQRHLEAMDYGNDDSGRRVEHHVDVWADEDSSVYDAIGAAHEGARVDPADITAIIDAARGEDDVTVDVSAITFGSDGEGSVYSQRLTSEADSGGETTTRFTGYDNTAADSDLAITFERNTDRGPYGMAAKEVEALGQGIVDSYKNSRS